VAPGRPPETPRAALLGAALLGATLAACASTRIPDLSEELGDVPPVAELADVPFYPQKRHQCGPASLAMALHWTGDPVTPEELIPSVYTPEREGSLQTEMVSATLRRGRVAYPVADLASLIREMAAGHPVVVLQNLAFGWYPVWHYAVVVGYDLPRARITVRSGRARRYESPLGLFTRVWERADRWAIVVLPAGTLPASAQEERYVAAVAGLERAGQWDPASRAYRSALERWPDSVAAWIGLGNSRYALGDLAGAERALRGALRVDPAAAPALNNLAHVLAEQGRREEAIAAARQAFASGGPHAEIYAKTLRELEGAGPSPD
jgi:hypothetical protein